MVPHKITLKNFLSYGEELQTIDFKNYNLICFSGRNGHGKSALLDAMTWALWGQARKITGTIKADDGLLRLGGQRMMVVLNFHLIIGCIVCVVSLQKVMASRKLHLILKFLMMQSKVLFL